MYAIVALSGKQYYVEQGKFVNVELNSELKKIPEGESFTISNVLLINKDNNFKVGGPMVAGATVKTTVLKHGFGKKIRVETYRKRKDSKRTYGHKQPFVQLRIDEIQAGN